MPNVSLLSQVSLSSRDLIQALRALFSKFLLLVLICDGMVCLQSFENYL